MFRWSGYHLLFLGFLFAYSRIALPLLLWLTQDTGRRLIAWVGGLCDRRGGLFRFLIPLMLAQLILRALYFAEHRWADFAYTLVFFVSGYILCAHQRFIQAVRRSWPPMLIAGITQYAGLLATAAAGVALAWMPTPRPLPFYPARSVFSVNGWCWTTFVLYVGMRFLDFSNSFLQYWQEAILPFFLLHQSVIIVISFYVVQWDVGIRVKLPFVALGSFVVTLGQYELLGKRINPLRALLGMKGRRRGMPLAG